MVITSLGWTKVLAGSGSSWSGTTSLLDAESTALVDLALKATLGGVGLLRCDHLDETETTRFTSVRVAHDAASLDITVLLKETTDLVLGQTRVDASDEEVGARVCSLLLIFVVATRLGWWRTTVVNCVSRSSIDLKSAVSKAYRSSRVAGDALRILLSPSRSGRGERERSRGY